MDPNGAITNASRLLIDLSFHYKLTLDTDITPANNDIVLREKDRITSGLCVHKVPGQNRFTLNTSVLNIGGLTSNFDMVFIGTPNGANRILWKPELPPPGYADITTAAGAARVTNLSGSFETIQTLLTPAQSATCDGEFEAIAATMATTGNANNLSAHASRSGSIDADIVLTNIAISARCGSETSFAVSIRQHPHSNCVVEAVEGTVADFYAIVTNVPAGALVRIQWSVAGGVAVGLATGTSFRAMMPAAATPVAVAVEVTVGLPDQNGVIIEQTVGDSLDVFVINSAFAETLESFCAIVHEMRPNRFVDPLWDPLRQVIRQPLTQAQLLELRRFSGQVDELTRRLLDQEAKLRALSGARGAVAANFGRE